MTALSRPTSQGVSIGDGENRKNLVRNNFAKYKHKIPKKIQKQIHDYVDKQLFELGCSDVECTQNRTLMWAKYRRVWLRDKFQLFKLFFRLINPILVIELLLKYEFFPALNMRLNKLLK